MDATGAPEYAPPALVRSSDVWFYDGTVVLQAETTLFRVYCGVLANQSPIFSDMFSIPQPATAEMYDGVPLVVLHDSSEDLQTFLMALHDAGYFVHSPVIRFSSLSALLKLATKYDVEHLRTRMVSLLKRIYPSALTERRARKLPPGYTEILFDDFRALDLASDHNVPSVLPAIYYECCRYSTDSILEAPISLGHKAKCILAAETYQDKWSRRIHAPMLSSAPLCLNQSECDAARLSWILANGLPKLSVIFSREFDWKALELCERCRQEGKTVYKTQRAALWEALPSLFGLPPWEELLKVPNSPLA